MYWADAQPHQYYQQHQLMLLRYGKDIKRDKINMFDLTRYFVDNGWIKAIDNNGEFYKTYFPFRSFVLTLKGDEYYRLLAIEHGADYGVYRYFDREEAKK